MLRVVAIACALAVCSVNALPHVRTHEKDVIDRMFSTWKMEFNKTYETLEEHMERMIIFAENAAIVKTHNAGGYSWTLGLNKYADMTNEEFTERHQLFQGSTMGTNASTAKARHVNSGKAASSVDWRNEGLVGPIKDQGQCGSCWAFSTAASVEGQVAKKSGTYTSLSEQALVDCVKDQTISGSSSTCCSGCSGGLMDYGFEWLIDNESGKDDTETSYSYTAKDGTCSFTSGTQASVGITSYSDVEQGDESSLKDAVGTVGPVSIAVNAGGSAWQLYTGGVYSPWSFGPFHSCNPNSLDHGVALVGYGTDSGTDYWIIRNSWGDSWGEDGYMRIKYGSNACGVANSASYPVV